MMPASGDWNKHCSLTQTSVGEYAPIIDGSGLCSGRLGTVELCIIEFITIWALLCLLREEAQTMLRDRDLSTATTDV
jgi:hypothetical protein